MSDTTKARADVEGGSLEDALKLQSGQANAEAPHLVVPLYMPLAPSVSLDEALRYVDSEHQARAKDGKIDLIAVATGTMREGERSDSLQLVLYKDRQGYWTFGTIDGLIEMAVLMDGHGLRYLSGKKLDREESVRRWMSGFLNWNYEYPGLYRLRYSMIDPSTEEPQAAK